MTCRPSDMAGIEDSYTAYCFDEAVANVIARIKDGEEPIARANSNTKSEYSRPSELYGRFDTK